MDKNYLKYLNCENDIITIFGATASGKSAFSIEIANYLKKNHKQSVIINADSAQIYRETPILSNLPTISDLSKFPHKLFSYSSITDDSSVVDWLTLCSNEVQHARKQKAIPIIVGGSGLYIKSLLYGLSNIPASNTAKEKAIQTYEKVGYNNFLDIIKNIDIEYTKKVKDPQKLIRAYEVYLISGEKFSTLQKSSKKKFINGTFTNIYLYPDRKLLYEKINKRTLQMFQKNIIEEALNVLKITTLEKNLRKVLGLRELKQYLNKEIDLQQCVELIQQKTRNYAKKQITWFNNQIKNKIIITE